MKRINRNVLLGILSSVNIIFANVGGVFTYPSIIGEPVTYGLTDVSIDSEHVYISLYKTKNEIKGTFKAEYFLSRNFSGDTLFSGLFYGIRADSVKIYRNGNLINQDIDSGTTKIFDSLFLIKTIHANRRLFGYYFDKNFSLSRNGYKFSFKKDEKNVLTVTGILSPLDMQLWGLAVYASFPFYKHPWLNSSALPQETQISYLISPISTWEKVGEITFRVDYPEKWETTMIDFQDSRWGNIDTIQPEQKSISNGITYLSHTFTDTKTEYLVLCVDRPRSTFYPGGPFLGFGGSEERGFLCNFSWDFAARLGHWTGALGRIGFESNFKDYNAIAPEIQVTSIYSWLFSAKAGLPYNLNKKELSLRIGGSIDYMILGITFNWDYLTHDKKWVNSILGTITF